MPLQRKRSFLLMSACLLAVVYSAGSSGGEGGPQAGKGGHARQSDAPEVFLTDIPAYRGNVIMGRPTDHSVILSVLLFEAQNIQVQYGTRPDALNQKSARLAVTSGIPCEMLVEGLTVNTRYYYRIENADSGAALLPTGGIGSFWTCRAPGSSFTFTVQADSHLDGNSIAEVYKTCLQNQRADAPDFLIDLGDTFMTGKHPSRDSAALQYAAQRYYFGLIGDSAPVFLVVGNHDGEEVRKPEAASAGGLAVWSCLQRKKYFPNPVPDLFYSGNAEKQANAGLLQDYYSWIWGDALFVVLDPYWTSGPTRGGKEPWNMTLGKPQYQWLAKTLREARTAYKFVFIHQLVGGLDASGRGGSEAALRYEWGGQEANGENTFVQHRTGWEMPIHALLKECGVTIVFHGHDHFYARQEKDGVIYQLVPQPCNRSYTKFPAEEYGYREGILLANSGYIRVAVSPEEVKTSYVLAATPDLGRKGFKNNAIADEYHISSDKGMSSVHHRKAVKGIE